MVTQLMFLIAFIAAIILLSLVAGLIDSLRRPVRGRREVEATITNIQVEASFIRSWWTITAEWTDPQTGQHYYFRSPRLHSHPHHRVGEQIAVNFHTTKPKDYHMEL